MFHPQTGRSPLRQRTQNVYVDLYNQASHKTPPKKDSSLSQPKINQNSEKIIKDLKSQRLREIFDSLDSDKDGWISSSKIAVRAVSPKILEVIAPVLYEMEEFNFSLNFYEFADALERLIKTLTSQTKADLFNYSKKHVQPSDLSYPHQVITSPRPDCYIIYITFFFLVNQSKLYLIWARERKKKILNKDFYFKYYFISQKPQINKHSEHILK